MTGLAGRQGIETLNPRLIFSSSVIPAKAGIQFISIAVLGLKAISGLSGKLLLYWQ
jgi:hypothetical protein